MSNKKSPRQKGSRPSRKRNARSVVVLSLALSLITSVAVLARRSNSLETSPQNSIQDAKLTPASFQANKPTKEYIYSGGKLIATEEPNSISPTIQSFAGDGGTGSVNVTALAEVNWTAVSNAPSWISIISGSSGSGNGTVNYSVAVNPDSAIRNGTITIHGQTFTVYQGKNFVDVPSSHEFYTDIGRLAARSVTLGCNGTDYCPELIVTRGEMAAFIIRALGDFNPLPPSQQRFSDVPSTNIFYAFIEQMALRQITLGCGGGNYCPGNPVLHEQMAAFIMRGKGEFSPPTPTSQRFNDVIIPPPPPTPPPPNVNPFASFIERMGALGIWPGTPQPSNCAAGNYCPAQGVKRSHMARILVRAFNL